MAGELRSTEAGVTSLQRRVLRHLTSSSRLHRASPDTLHAQYQATTHLHCIRHRGNLEHRRITFEHRARPLGSLFSAAGVHQPLESPLSDHRARDVAALGMAIAGFIVAGPMELFLPAAATNRFGAYVWLLLLAFYGLCLTLVVLLMRPRLVIYNAQPRTASLDSRGSGQAAGRGCTLGR